MMRALARSMAAAAGVSFAAPALAQTAEDAANEAYRLCAAQEYEAAAEATRMAVERDPSDSAYRLLLADALAQSGEQAKVPDVLDPTDAGYPTQSRLAEAFFATHQWLAAADAFRLATASAPAPDRRSYSMRAEALSLIYAGERSQAAEVVRRAVADPELDTANSLDWAMVAIYAGEDRLGQQILADEAVARQLTRQTALDAAYSAKRAGLDARAVEFFERGLALDEQASARLSASGRESIRREVALLSRRWVAHGQLAYGETERLPAFLTRPANTNAVAQAGAEVGYRPGGWRNGRPVTLFARVFGAMDAGSGSGTQDAVQGWIGVQHKPFANLNLVVEASRLIAVAGPALDDWGLRAAFSASKGLEPEATRPHWPFRDVYADLAYLTDADAGLGLVRGRYGHSFALTRATNPLVVTPFAVSQVSYDSMEAEDFALGAGGGVSVRQWLGGKACSAPDSYVELTAQARTRVAGARRANGLQLEISFGF